MYVYERSKSKSQKPQVKDITYRGLPSTFGTETAIKQSGDVVGGLYSSALSRFAARLQEAKTDFGKAEAPLAEAVGMFRPGGEYGAGQKAIIEQEAKEALGAGQTSLVQTGMASGSTMAGIHGLVSSEATKQFLGVEDVRTENLANALTALSNLKASAAGALLTAATQEPSYAPVAGFEATKVGALSQLATAKLGAHASLEAAQMGAEASMFGSKASAEASIASSLIGAQAQMASAQMAANARNRWSPGGSGNTGGGSVGLQL